MFVNMWWPPANRIQFGWFANLQSKTFNTHTQTTLYLLVLAPTILHFLHIHLLQTHTCFNFSCVPFQAGTLSSSHQCVLFHICHAQSDIRLGVSKDSILFRILFHFYLIFFCSGAFVGHEYVFKNVNCFCEWTNECEIIFPPLNTLSYALLDICGILLLTLFGSIW